MMTGIVMLLAGGILLPTSEKNLGIIFMSCFWVPYGAYWSIRRARGSPLPSKVPVAPVLSGPLPVAAVAVAAPTADEDPAPAP
jgi:hypothetical protein